MALFSLVGTGAYAVICGASDKNAPSKITPQAIYSEP